MSILYVVTWGWFLLNSLIAGANNLPADIEIKQIGSPYKLQCVKGLAKTAEKLEEVQMFMYRK